MDPIKKQQAPQRRRWLWALAALGITCIVAGTTCAIVFGLRAHDNSSASACPEGSYDVSQDAVLHNVTRQQGLLAGCALHSACLLEMPGANATVSNYTLALTFDSACASAIGAAFFEVPANCSGATLAAAATAGTSLAAACPGTTVHLLGAAAAPSPLPALTAVPAQETRAEQRVQAVSEVPSPAPAPTPTAAVKTVASPPPAVPSPSPSPSPKSPVLPPLPSPKPVAMTVPSPSPKPPAQAAPSTIKTASPLSSGSCQMSSTGLRQQTAEAGYWCHDDMSGEEEGGGSTFAALIGPGNAQACGFPVSSVIDTVPDNDIWHRSSCVHSGYTVTRACRDGGDWRIRILFHSSNCGDMCIKTRGSSSDGPSVWGRSATC